MAIDDFLKGSNQSAESRVIVSKKLRSEGYIITTRNIFNSVGNSTTQRYISGLKWKPKWGPP
ncbi:MAG TPA: hypothetical protein PLI99_01235 [archaeon]|nr:hypothetical protein [archaeon]